MFRFSVLYRVGSSLRTYYTNDGIHYYRNKVGDPIDHKITLTNIYRVNKIGTNLKFYYDSNKENLMKFINEN